MEGGESGIVKGGQKEFMSPGEMKQYFMADRECGAGKQAPSPILGARNPSNSFTVFEKKTLNLDDESDACLSQYETGDTRNNDQVLPPP